MCDCVLRVRPIPSDLRFGLVIHIEVTSPPGWSDMPMMYIGRVSRRTGNFDPGTHWLSLLPAFPAVKKVINNPPNRAKMIYSTTHIADIALTAAQKRRAGT